MDNMSRISNGVPVFERRVAEMEKQTEEMYAQIAKLGIDGSYDDKNTSKYKPIAPTRVHNGDRIEAPVQRLCQLESTVQMLKATVTRLQADLDLSRKDIAAAKDKEKAAKALEQELQRTRAERTQLSSQCDQLEMQKRALEDQLANLQLLSTVQPSVAMERDGLQAAKQKLEKKMAEARDELQREKSLRSSLEQSHQTMLLRIRELEENIEHERDQVKVAGGATSTLKRDLKQAQEEALMERQQRERCEQQVLALTKQTDALNKKIVELDEDKRLLLNEARKAEDRNAALLLQLKELEHTTVEAQELQQRLSKDNRTMKEMVEGATAKNATIIAKYEQDIESQRAQLIKVQLLEEQVTQLTEKLKVEARAKSQAVDNCGELEAALKAAQEEVRRKEEELRQAKTGADELVTRVRGELRQVEIQRDQALRDRDTLVTEVKKRVENAGSEKDQVEAMLTKADVELKGLRHTVHRLELENGNLTQRLLDAEQRQETNSKLEKNLAELVEQKSRLAYEKGHLTSQVTQLQGELESMAKQHADLVKYRQTAAALDAKCSKQQEELVEQRLALQQAECQVKQWQAVSERKERDFELALHARDDALKEVMTLRDALDAANRQCKTKVGGVEEMLSAAHSEHRKLTDTLETVMASHKKLQDVAESLQQELGSRDCQLSQALRDKAELMKQLQQVQRDKEKLEQKILRHTDHEVNEVPPLRQALSKAQTDHRRLMLSVDELHDVNCRLQATVDMLSDELEKKAAFIEQIEQARQQDRDSHRGAIKVYEERLDNVQQLLNKERDKNIKRSSRDVAAVQQELNDSHNKNQELFRQNRQLSQQVSDLSNEVKDTKKKVSQLKAQLKNASALQEKHKGTVDNFNALRDQVAALEKARNDYVAKYKRQATTLEQLMTQLSLLETEMKALTESHVKTSAIMQEQEEALTRERRHAEQWKAKYKLSRDRETRTSQMLHDAEQRLLNATELSLQTSSTTQDSQDWFKAKLDQFQQEADSYRTSKAELEKENREIQKMLNEERQQAKQTAERAKTMLKASRETIARLGEFAEVAKRQTNSQLETMRHELDMERGHSAATREKLHQLQESSLRYTEELAAELDVLRNQSTLLTLSNLSDTSLT